MNYDALVERLVGRDAGYCDGYFDGLLEAGVVPRFVAAMRSKLTRPLTSVELGWLGGVDSVEARVRLSFWGEAGPETDTCTHTEHCCVDHGCKYGDSELCPVYRKEKRQNFTCPYCDPNSENYGW